MKEKERGILYFFFLYNGAVVIAVRVASPMHMVLDALLSQLRCVETSWCILKCLNCIIKPNINTLLIFQYELRL